MAKIVQNSKFRIPHNNYFPDSGKFYIDSIHFSEVNIPKSATLLSDGEISDFKDKAVQVPFAGQHVYIASVKKKVKQMRIDKVLIYFSAKIAGDDYFYGIKRHHMIDVLNHLMKIGYLVFKDVNEICKQIYCPHDLDIKNDFKLHPDDRPKIKIYYEQLRDDRFQGTKENCIVYPRSVNDKKNGLGIQTYHRDKCSIVKPFLKFYDKTEELNTKSREFFNTLPEELQNEVNDNFVNRFEINIKDNTFFKKFGISNRFEDILEIPQEKWHEIANYMMNTNFQVKVKKPRDQSKLRPVEKMACLSFLIHIEHGLNATQIKDIYTKPQTDKKAKYRMSLLFDKIYYHTTLGSEREVRKNYDMITKWDKYFGFFGMTQKSEQ
jgi:hypothetical protein